MFNKFLLLFFCICGFTTSALKIVINQGIVQKHSIAIVASEVEDVQKSKFGQDICDVISNDLENSGLFRHVPQNNFLAGGQLLNGNGKIAGATFLCYISISQGSNKNFSINMTLIDIFSGKTMLSYKIEGSHKMKKKIAHTISDTVYKRITNQDGYFNTNIIYVETSTKKNSKRKTRLVKIDQDGCNRKVLKNIDGIILTPRYSNDGKLIAYISYKDNTKNVLEKSANAYIMNLESGNTNIMISKYLMKKLVAKNNGAQIQMTYAPRFSSNNSEAVLAIIINGKSAIYSINLENKELSQLTAHSCIDTSPCYSNDDRKIVFTSNRMGQEAIYIMNADGSNQKKISNGEGKYSQPVWSPRGDLIAFTKQSCGEFFIGVMNTDGTGERLISSGYLVEAPSWASNGRYIVFSKEFSAATQSKICIVDITGYHNMMLNIAGDGSCPAWSPAVAA